MCFHIFIVLVALFTTDKVIKLSVIRFSTFSSFCSQCEQMYFSVTSCSAFFPFYNCFWTNLHHSEGVSFCSADISLAPVSLRFSSLWSDCGHWWILQRHLPDTKKNLDVIWATEVWKTQKNEWHVQLGDHSFSLAQCSVWTSLHSDRISCSLSSAIVVLKSVSC